jgi:hypothetical protein
MMRNSQIELLGIQLQLKDSSFLRRQESSFCLGAEFELKLDPRLRGDDGCRIGLSQSGCAT